MNDIIEVPVMVPVNKVGALYAAVAALMGSTAPMAVARGSTAAEAAAPKAAPIPQSETAPAAAADTSGGAASGEVDVEGWPWSEDMHASTKTKTKAGLWRMKVGVTRPEPKAGFSKAGGTDDAPTAATSSPANGAASASSTPAATDDEDEFAAFREAAAKSDTADANAAAKVAERKWTDADLGKLCSMAATKLGDPAPVKALITEYVPTGTVSHSRNIPDEKREAFAKAVEAKAGVTFEG